MRRPPSQREPHPMLSPSPSRASSLLAIHSTALDCCIGETLINQRFGIEQQQRDAPPEERALPFRCIRSVSRVVSCRVVCALRHQLPPLREPSAGDRFPLMRRASVRSHRDSLCESARPVVSALSSVLWLLLQRPIGGRSFEAALIIINSLCSRPRLDGVLRGDATGSERVAAVWEQRTAAAAPAATTRSGSAVGLREASPATRSRLVLRATLHSHSLWLWHVSTSTPAFGAPLVVQPEERCSRFPVSTATRAALTRRSAHTVHSSRVTLITHCSRSHAISKCSNSTDRNRGERRVLSAHFTQKFGLHAARPELITGTRRE